MGILDDLKFSSATLPTGVKSRDPLAPARNKLADALKEQSAILISDLENKPFTKYDPKTGKPKAVRRWWGYAIDGTLLFQVRYGTNALPLGPMKQVNIIVKDLNELSFLIGRILSAIEAGELDEHLRKAIQINKPKSPRRKR